MTCCEDRRMKKTLILLAAAALLVLASCGDEDDDSSGGTSAAAQEEAAMKKEEAAMKKEEAAMKKEEAAMKKEGSTTVTTVDSEFGEVLVDTNEQAIYIFENDSAGQTNCTGECAAAWPPVFTSGKPQASGGVDGSMLGTIERPDGGLQVTYDGKPLYYYAHEGPGEIRCHNVDLNGGFWWVIGPDGERRP
jgi:predicted lipoprotein with Yx(FWY)xxD motif